MKKVGSKKRSNICCFFECWGFKGNPNFRGISGKHSTLIQRLIYVEIMLRRRSTYYQCWIDVILSTLIQRWGLTLKQRWLLVDTINSFTLMLWGLRNHKLYINVEKKQRHFVNVKSTLSLTFDQVEFRLTLKAVLPLCYDAWEIINFILTLRREPHFNVETTSFSRR